MTHHPTGSSPQPDASSSAGALPGAESFDAGPAASRLPAAAGARPPLLDRILARDESALADLYDLHGAGVYGLALRVVRSPGDAEEVTQEVFLYVWEKARLFDARRGSMVTWLFTLARSRAIDRIRQFRSQERRRAGLRLEVEADEGAPRRLPDSAAEEEQTRRGIRAALDGLPAEQRQVLELAYFEGLSQSEIAARQDTPLGTVKTRMRQGMLRLRASLGSPTGLMEQP